MVDFMEYVTIYLKTVFKKNNYIKVDLYSLSIYKENIESFDITQLKIEDPNLFPRKDTMYSCYEYTTISDKINDIKRQLYKTKQIDQINYTESYSKMLLSSEEYIIDRF